MRISEKPYFNWLISIVCEPKDRKKYSILLEKLYETEYRWVISRDECRAADGIALRDRFDGDGYVPFNQKCSVLEMLVALAWRCETDYMGDLTREDRTSEWFWVMIHNLELDFMDDKHYDEYEVDEILDIWMTNDYEFDGKGGLFYIKDIFRDMRKEEIWVQMMWFINYFREEYE